MGGNIDWGGVGAGSALDGYTGGVIGGSGVDPIGFLSGRSGISKAGDLSQQGFTAGISGLQDFMKTLAPMYKDYMDVGASGAKGLQNPSDPTTDPQFQNLLKAGTDASNMNAAGSGHLFGGGHEKALQAFGQNMGHEWEQQQFQNNLAKTSTGMNATSNLAGNQMGIQEMISKLIMGKGQDAAATETAKNQGMQQLMQMGVQAAAIAFSDRRLKKNITRIGTHALGIGVYEFDYLWDEHAVGVMADEVEKVMPAAVGEAGGYKYVNYSMLQGA
jgi:hypothetical protein